MRQRGFLAVLLLAAIVGVVASAASFGFLELAHELQPWIYNDLPDALGFKTRPDWWALPVLAIAGLLAAVAIVNLPGIGGHIPANGLNPAPTQPIELPGVLFAALASIGFGVVLGPEAPLIAMGGAIGFLVIRLVRRDAPPEVQQVIAACGTFAAVSFLFGSPVIAAVLMIEAAGIGGSRLPLVLVPRAARRRNRLADLDRPRLVDRRRHERHRDRHRDPARLRPTRALRLRLDDPARRGDRDRDLRDLHDRPPHRPDRVRPAVPGAAGGGHRDRRAGDPVRPDDRPQHRPGAVRARRTSRRSSPTRRRSRPGPCSP